MRQKTPAPHRDTGGCGDPQGAGGGTAAAAALHCDGRNCRRRCVAEEEQLLQLHRSLRPLLLLPRQGCLGCRRQGQAAANTAASATCPASADPRQAPSRAVPCPALLHLQFLPQPLALHAGSEHVGGAAQGPAPAPRRCPCACSCSSSCRCLPNHGLHRHLMHQRVAALQQWLRGALRLGLRRGLRRGLR